MSGYLDHSPAEVIRKLIVQLGYGSYPDDESAWPVFFSHMPDSPDSAICVYDTEGRHGGRAMVNGEVQEHHGVQVRVRCLDNGDGWKRTKDIITAFDMEVSRTYVEIGSQTYRIQSISRTSDVISLGPEGATRRRLFTANAYVSLRLLPGTGSYL